MKKIVLIILLVLTFQAQSQEWHYSYTDDKIQLNGASTISWTDGGYAISLIDGLHVFTDEGKQLFYYPLELDGLESITQIEEDEEGYFVLISNNRFEKYSYDGSLLFSNNLQVSVSQGITSETPCMFKLNNGNVMVGEVGGVKIFDKNNGSIKEEVLILNQLICSILPLNDGYVVMGRDDQDNGYVNILNNQNTIVRTDTFNNIRPFAMTKSASELFITGSTNDSLVVFKWSENDGLIWNKKFDFKRGEDIILNTEEELVIGGLKEDSLGLLTLNKNGGFLREQLYLKKKSHSRISIIETKNREGYMLVTPFEIMRVLKNKAFDGTSKILLNFNQAELTVNNSRGFVQSDGELFNTPKFSSATHPDIDLGGLWIGGMDKDDKLHLSANTHKVDDYKNDFQPGFLEIENSNKLMDKVWHLYQSDIQSVIEDFEDGQYDYPIPHDILTYPAKGNIHAKGNLKKSIFEDENDLVIVLDYFDFFDKNEDGVYNVYDGDYPIIKGDELLTWVMNDDTNHDFTNGIGLGVNIIGRMYAYECEENTKLNQSFFLEYEIYNLSSHDYDSVFVGLYNQFRIGCFFDDYSGIDSARNTIFSYNATENDDQICTSLGTSLPNGLNLPIQTVSLLNHNFSSYNTYYLGSFGFNHLGLPFSTTQFYNNLNGRLLNGSTMKYGFDFFQGTEPTNFVFTGNPSDTSQWSMLTAGINSDNGSSLGSIGPFELKKDSVLTFTYLYSEHTNVPQPFPDIFSVIDTVMFLKEDANQGTLEWSITLEEEAALDENNKLELAVDISNATYSWSTGAMTPQITVTDTGYYEVTVTNQNGCIKSKGIQVLPFEASDLMEESILIIPNPARSQFRIKTDFEYEILQMYNGQGQLVLAEIHSNSTVVNISKLQAGQYFIVLINNLGKFISEKIIVY